VRRRRSSAAGWLVLPALVCISVVGARQWSKRDPLVATLSTSTFCDGRGALQVSGRDRGRAVAGEPSMAVSARLIDEPAGSVGQSGGRSSATFVVAPALLAMGVPATPSGGAPSSHSGSVEDAPNPPGVRISVDDGVGEAPVWMQSEPRDDRVYLGAEQRVTVRGTGAVPPELLQRLQQTGTGPWEIDLRYRGVIVIREEAP
jgi:hypothetical protein